VIPAVLQMAAVGAANGRRQSYKRRCWELQVISAVL
jgi:hypothetical protein